MTNDFSALVAQYLAEPILVAKTACGSISTVLRTTIHRTK